jgi:protein ImuB
VQLETGELAGLLRRFSPEVEISPEEPGVFWLNAAGLSGLFPSLDFWARNIHTALTVRGRRASVVVGFRRFAVYALARGREGFLVMATPGEEETALRQVSLAGLAIDPLLRDTLAKLGIQTLGEFLRLPAPAIRRRFGNEAERLQALASGGIHDPLSPVFPVEPVGCLIVPEAPEGNSLRLLFTIQKHLPPLLTRLAERGQALRELEVRFLLEGRQERRDRIRPAEATLDESLILDLLRLRLEGSPLIASVKEIGLTVYGRPAVKQQLRLFVKAHRRDLAAANRALARVRADLGEEAVVRARLTEGHLPEARFAWEPLSDLSEAHPHGRGKPLLVRRLYSQPLSLPVSLKVRPRPGPDQWLIRGLDCGPVIRSWGPYILSGEWWRSSSQDDGWPIQRHYYFLETRNGNVLWVYYDGPRRQWFLQGQVA